MHSYKFSPHTQPACPPNRTTEKGRGLAAPLKATTSVANQPPQGAHAPQGTACYSPASIMLRTVA